MADKQASSQGSAAGTGTEEKERALTPRAIIIGAVGSIVLTASSLFVALRMGMLPWPIAFAAIVSVLVLRACGSHNLHEANVAHAAMSAGSMVAGGLAFTIPGLWIMGVGDDLGAGEVLICALAGCALGLAACWALEPDLIHRRKLAFPIGRSAADTLRAVGGDDAKDAPALFGGMAFAGIYALLRDVFGILPQLLFSSNAIQGVALGLSDSPMTLAMGFMVGVVPTAVWFAGAILGHLGITWGFQALLGWSAADAANLRVSLGLGLMLGCGAGSIVSGFIKAGRASKAEQRAQEEAAAAAGRDGESGAAQAEEASDGHGRHVRALLGLSAAVCACIITIFLHLPFLASIIIILGSWFFVYLSAWLTGTTGVDPMEIFGMLVLMLIQAIFHDVPLKTLFLSAAVVAVACGTGGDVMNDLKAGDEIGTDPRDQMAGMAVGAFVGAIVASLLLLGLHAAYGSGAFGPDQRFVSVQAANVAAMAGGIPNVAGFVAGLAAGCVMTLFDLPVMTLGLGVYLPFYMSSGAIVGAVVRVVADHLAKKRGGGARVAEVERRGQTIASGMLGGESLVGVIVALVVLATSLG